MSQAHRPLYEQSSQFRNWRFSREKLHEIRKLTNQAGVERAQTNIEAEQVGYRSNKQVNYLSLDDELALCHFYETKIDTFARHFKLPNQVKATAIVYMKRFFLYNTVMDYSPKSVMLTCLYLASKTENKFIQVEDFAKPIPKTSSQDILTYEFVVSQSLKFEYTVHHPFSPLYGFYLDAQILNDNISLLTQVYSKAMDYCNTSLYTDLTFIYFPGQIALACLKLAAQDLNWNFAGYLHQKYSDEATRLALEAIVDDIIATIKARKPVSTDIVREVDRRLIYCRNPEKDPSSLL
ncbi:cyclin-like protein [Dimargaris cristalligena]|uniref:Cyclin-like protein n=1 Tax=Dimargaris cristalligena TaxID=215637 RepID=A0A4P9ZRB5_9FUNG|nr:cyclin-like protein [Dimargaris cristalligena]|eukprot:RKP36066.1 cyclin-like protein [Dimargaris cristalligena]